MTVHRAWSGVGSLAVRRSDTGRGVSGRIVIDNRPPCGRHLSVDAVTERDDRAAFVGNSTVKTGVSGPESASVERSDHRSPFTARVTGCSGHSRP